MICAPDLLYTNVLLPWVDRGWSGVTPPEFNGAHTMVHYVSILGRSDAYAPHRQGHVPQLNWSTLHVVEGRMKRSV